MNDKINLIDATKYKKGNLIFEDGCKTISQCMHSNTGKLLGYNGDYGREGNTLGT